MPSTVMPHSSEEVWPPADILSALAGFIYALWVCKNAGSIQIG